jgi:selenocysteine lyase/cysteine desulfurase
MFLNCWSMVLSYSGPQDILRVVEESMGPNTKLAVFDAITSNTAVVLPLADLVALCRRR